MKWFTKILVVILLATLITFPPLIYGYANLWLAETSSNRTDSARYYETAAKFLFWRPELYEKAGILTLDDPQHAISLLTTARQKEVLSSNGQIILGDIYLAGGNTGQAVSLWENLAASKLDIPNVAPRLARIYHTLHEFDKEESILAIWLETDKNNLEANEQLGRILAARAAPEALPLLKIAEAGSPTTASRLNGLISALETTGDNPAYRLAKCGQALAGLDEWPLAEQAFTHAVHANSAYAEAWAWLGLARQHNQTSGAEQAFKTALKLNNDSAAIRIMYGTYLQQIGKPGDALEEFTKATQIEPGNPAWWQALADSAANLDLSTALNAYIHAVDLAPQVGSYWYALAAFCVEKNAYIEDYGLNAALHAFALDPHNPAYMDMLGRAQMAAGQNAAAEIMFDKVLNESGSTYPEFIVHFHLGLLYFQTGRSEQAKSEFEQTLELDPQGSYGAQAKKIIERYFP